MKIAFQTSQKLLLSKNLVFSLKILTLNSNDLFQFVENATLSNPAIHFVNRKFLQSHFSSESSENYAAKNTSSPEHALFEKIHEEIESFSYAVNKKKFLHCVVDNFLDEKFFLKRNEFLKKFTMQQYHECRRFFKKLSPAGIGACHLQERFKYQLESCYLEKSIAYRIVDECWKYFLLKNNTKIQKLLKITENEIQQALKQIQKNCRPNIVEHENDSNDSVQHFTQPDIILKENGSLELNEHFLPKIKINENFLNLTNALANKKDLNYRNEKLKQAKDIILAIQKRNETILNIVRIIINLRSGAQAHSSSKKITLKDIALKANVSQSTVSRALKNKTILTKFGIVYLGQFMRESRKRRFCNGN